MVTVIETLERYKELRELFNSTIFDIKESLADIKTDLNTLSKEQADLKSDIRSILQEGKWKNKEYESIRKDINNIEKKTSNCPVCNEKIDINEILKIISANKTRSAIAISLLLILIVALMTHIVTNP